MVRKMKLFGILVLLSVLTSTLAVSFSSAAFPVLDISSMLNAYFDLNSWYGMAALLALAAVSAAAVVYMLASTVGSNRVSVWAKAQIYEALLAIMFIAIFFGLYSWLLINPQPYFGAAGMVPSSCTATTDIYSLSACDMGSFLSESTQWFSALFYVSYFIGFAPGFTASFSVAAGTAKASTSLPSLLPGSTEETLAIVFDFLIPAIMINEVQMILLSAAPLLFAMLLSLGTLAWIFGFSRRFGGTMIALAVGVGIIYPLLVSLTYGFVMVQISNIMPNVLSRLPDVIASFTGGILGIPGEMAALSSLAGAIFSAGSYLFAGLIMVPVLNFMVLDAFVSDFSKAIGVRMTFMELIGNLL